VFRYLGRYSHRVAIANSRLVALEDDQVFFRWKDYADDHRTKVMRLTADEFIRRFLLHVLPKRFVRIRHYGLLAGRNVGTKLARCRQLLGVPNVAQPSARAGLDQLPQGTLQFRQERCALWAGRNALLVRPPLLLAPRCGSTLAHRLFQAGDSRLQAQNTYP
jgi:hypothetical protein